MKVAMTLVAITTLGVGSTYLAQEPKASPLSPPAIIRVVDEADALEKARCSVFAIMLDEERSGGSAILVGRQKLDNGNYLYRAITAYHVVDSMVDRITKKGAEANRKLQLLFQPQFHSKPLRVTVEVDDIDWAVPAHDWGSFTFELPHKLHCSTLATKAEFQSVKFTDRIYLIGCGGLYAPHVRTGNIGATHNHYIMPRINSPRPWDKNPDRYFKPSIPVWYGDSGGGVFNKDGKLIGIVNGFSIQNRWTGSFVPHSGVALKGYVILDVAQHSKDFFLVEE